MPKRKHESDGKHDRTLADTSPLEYLIKPESLSNFFETVWEKAPKFYKSQSERQALFPKLGTLSDLQSLLKDTSDTELDYGVDINVARYLDGVRETIRPVEKAKLFFERSTLAMEKQLGCLVGANAYITPAGTQGLAPHYDDVNLWVCQTAGSKRWRIYNNRPGYELPAVSSCDFDQKVIGEPILDVTMEVGDVLFMPRGTVHQAVAQKEASSHITISTYQKWASADFACAVLQTLQQGQPATSFNSETPCLPPPLRKALPVGFLYTAGLEVDSTSQAEESHPTPSVATDAATALRDLADRLVSDPSLTSLTADTLALDFMASRAPPHPEHLPERGDPPSFTSRVRCVGKGYCRVLPCPQPSADVLDAYPEEKKFVRVVTCLKNDIKNHMMQTGPPEMDDGPLEDMELEALEEAVVRGEKQVKESGESSAANEGKANYKRGSAGEEDIQSSDDDDSDEEDEEEDDSVGGDLVFPASFTRALAQLLSSEEPLEVKDLRLRTKDDKLGLTYSLWEEGLICTVPSPAKKKSKA